jgi:hypothetical protein
MWIIAVLQIKVSEIISFQVMKQSFSVELVVIIKMEELSARSKILLLEVANYFFIQNV